jgi:hypothetical protein
MKTNKLPRFRDELLKGKEIGKEMTSFEIIAGKIRSSAHQSLG